MMPAMDPLMIDLPAVLASERVLLRAPRAGDGAALNDAMAESLETLKPWMPWAQEMPSLKQSELTCRQIAARFAQRTDLTLYMFERLCAPTLASLAALRGGATAAAERPGAADVADGDFGRLIGGTGLHRMDWNVPRFEIGYWCRPSMQGRGLVTEAVNTLMRFAFDTLQARRVEVRMSSTNARSRAVAERCGFTLEGVLRQDSRGVDGQPRDTVVYARVRGVEEPE
jgi:RimJ/RimL family protein N-acetyltransferase